MAERSITLNNVIAESNDDFSTYLLKFAIGGIVIDGAIECVALFCETIFSRSFHLNVRFQILFAA